MHPEQLPHRPSPLKAPSLRRGSIVGPKHDKSFVRLEVFLPNQEEQETEHRWNFSQIDQKRTTGLQDRDHFRTRKSGATVGNMKDGDERNDGIVKEDEIDRVPNTTKQKYVRGPDIDKESFIRIYSISALRVPVSECWDLALKLREHLLNWPRISNVGRVLGDDIDEDLASVFAETSEEKQSVKRHDVRAAVYADGEKWMSKKKLAVCNNSRKESSNQEALSNRNAAFRLDLEEEEEPIQGYEHEGNVSSNISHLNWSKKWTGPTRLLLLDEKYAGKEVWELPPSLQV